MKPLTLDDFEAFFGSLYKDNERRPLPPLEWQRELARRACDGDWPETISVPTGAGKTSAIEIAVFALAFQADRPSKDRTAAMRTFLVVDRRTVVSEAFHRAARLADALRDASEGILLLVADRLRALAGSAVPLKVVQLRGGIHRERTWCDSLTQPMLVTSTVDQVGSRLLFRGYGVSPLARSIQAAAVAYDSRVLLDEAHISPAFETTLKTVARYQRPPWLQTPVGRPVEVVSMTATPSGSGGDVLAISPTVLSDRGTRIGRIVNTQKPASLFAAANAKGPQAYKQLSAELAAAADRLVVASRAADAAAPRAVGILCNTVATAKATAELLRKNRSIDSDQVHLIIGAMRPIDRDLQTDSLRERIATGVDRAKLSKDLYVVATQCIEVGADFDFDVLVTEAAPLDALVQRFGRLNRAGRDAAAAGCIVMRGDYVKDDAQLKEEANGFRLTDPIYGNATSYTWNWLLRHADAGVVDFGIAAIRVLMEGMSEAERESTSAERPAAPALLPAHVDLLVQTTQEPWPDPDVSLWLHGPRRNDPEVQVCWRGDLLPPAERLPSGEGSGGESLALSFAILSDDEAAKDLVHAVSLCPPSSAECMSVPMRKVHAWLKSRAASGRLAPDDTGDVPAIVEEPSSDSAEIPPAFRPLAWRGLEHSELITDTGQVRPGDTLVFSVIAGGWNDLGYVPHADSDPTAVSANLQSQLLQKGNQSVTCLEDDLRAIGELDVASPAYRRARGRPVLRLHPNLILPPLDQSAFARMEDEVDAVRFSKAETREIIRSYPHALTEGFDFTSQPLEVDFYVFDEQRQGIVIRGPVGVANGDAALDGDDERDTTSHLSGQGIELQSHLRHVRDKVASVCERLALDNWSGTLDAAALMHDWGKADPRFQALLLGGDPLAAWLEEQLYAKSGKLPISLKSSQRAMEQSRLPRKFRHEMLSLGFAESDPDLTAGAEDPQLLLHLIASHHGYARPWAPFCNDPEPPDVDLGKIGSPSIALTADARKNLACHRVGSTVADRFWVLVRRYGWWGLAVFEAALRLADHAASRDEASAAMTQQITSRVPAGASS